MATREDKVGRNAGVMRIDLPFQPRIILLHYAAPTVVDTVDIIIAHQARLFDEAGYSTAILAGTPRLSLSTNL